MQPHQAYFGQKDAQQAIVISRLVSDFNLPVKLHILPTIREADGLAMSSRNAYLNQQERAAASVLHRALQAGRLQFTAHPLAETNLAIRAMIETVENEPRVRLDYAEIRDPDSFNPLEVLRAPALLIIAARVGSTRLIDNILLRTDGTWDTGVLFNT
jgi:pantoate--beta-alanine ligase